MSPAPRRQFGGPVIVTPRADRTLDLHVERVAQAEAIAADQRAAMYDAIASLVAAGEMTIEAAAAKLDVSKATLNRSLAARRLAKSQTDCAPASGLRVDRLR